MDQRLYPSQFIRSTAGMLLLLYAPVPYQQCIHLANNTKYQFVTVYNLQTDTYSRCGASLERCIDLCCL